jgi:ferrochelatase
MDPSNQYCLNNIDCCESNSPFNEMCYKFHCHTTVKKVVNKLKTKKPYQIGFQSRFGLDAWIKPNTTDVIESLPKEGIKKISVVCPAFVFDCLETLEEIAIRNNEYFVEAGGQSLKMIPALNDNDTWVNKFYGSIKNKFN